ncbi:ribose ABC transporter permease [Fervidobacterium pennivorans subsp. shakshaketiis]|jgi:ribose transport system permease protein|uniref:Monosaccharide ABC transporter membrane protein, CUT2 family n=1 Tax=Fervidobacterium pennivorans (strain DSM 9078 / Ven5) TaxID=771875 RepID=H9U9W5_FERPD|nr:ribose ABC transporter permease [Fervidobacterium pennivorans]AFG34308.1 monosaccharide ABC transporter membrane protein, CUT2 family [Fervidobacterium pennivorans DSM 9078]QIV77670.1 ribose ABC transporter permease [Fervidobacterium pennivorans subsp. keratinolyticus]
MNSKRLLAKVREYPAIVGLLGVVILFSLLSDRFFTLSNFVNVLRQVSMQAIIAFGMTVVIISGGIDLSVGSVFALSAAVLASIIAKSNSIFVGILAALLVGAAFGFFNGLLIAKGKLQPFIVTLATMAIARSLTLAYMEGMPITGFPSSFRFIGAGDVLGIPVPVIIMFSLLALMSYLTRFTKFGLYAYSIGGNELASRLSGVKVDLYKISFYVLSGILTAVSAVILTSRLNSAQPTFGVGYELDAIAAVVLGGASLSGGKGTVLGTFFGALIMGILNNGMNILNVSPFYQDAVKGIVILTAVLIEREG